MFFLYQILVALFAALVAVPWTLARIAAGRAGWMELRQRLGLEGRPVDGDETRVLVHAVSAGEVAAAEPVVRELALQAPHLSILLTWGNPSGGAAAARLEASLPKITGLGLLPWDLAVLLKAWLRRISPSAVVIAETEIWPALFLVCAELNIPLFVINGRVYEKDVPRYACLKPFLRRVLSAAEWVGAQSHRQRRNFIRIGAEPGKVEAIGNTKFDLALTGSPVELPGVEPSDLILLAGSTHWPEEEWLLDCLPGLRARFPSLKLVLAPRRMNRIKAIEKASTREGLRWVRWSQADASASWDVLIVDRFGILPGLYGQSAVAFIGGTLRNRGGHNPLEAAVAGRCAVLTGPFVENFRAIVEGMEQADALLRIPGPEKLQDCLTALLSDPARRRRMSQAALRFLASRRGASTICAGKLLHRLRPAPDGRRSDPSNASCDRRDRDDQRRPSPSQDPPHPLALPLETKRP